MFIKDYIFFFFFHGVWGGCEERRMKHRQEDYILQND